MKEAVWEVQDPNDVSCEICKSRKFNFNFFLFYPPRIILAKCNTVLKNIYPFIHTCSLTHIQWNRRGCLNWKKITKEPKQKNTIKNKNNV